MAFSFGSPGPVGSFGTSMSAQSSNAQVQRGPELEEIQTEGLGFLALAPYKVQLLPTPWPSNALPHPTSSLLSIASNKGIVAAAGPDALVLASTDAVREQFLKSAAAQNDIIPFEPQLKISMPMRVSQVAFSADESLLVVSAENGGGLAVYDVQAVMQGNTLPAFELGTNGASLRAIAPNPTPEKSEYFALVTTNGDLMMANLKERQFIAGPQGQVLKAGVSCVSWSTRGKQLVAGLGNGAAYQMTPEGQGKAEIPSPPDLPSPHHVSAIGWLENDVFLLTHTPTNFEPTENPPSLYNLATRQKGTQNFTFQQLVDPSPPFGMIRTPPFQFMVRLKDFPPNLADMLIVSSTASADIGLLTKSKAPLSKDVPADKITNVFTTTSIANDSRRAQMSVSDDGTESSPIGVALDLSSRSPVSRPILGDEMENSPTPLPALMVLNNEGLLAGWWVIYNESIRQNEAYSGLVSVSNKQPLIPQQSPQQVQPAMIPQTSVFGTPSLGGGLAKPSGTFGGPIGNTQPAFGASTAPSAGAFGSAATLGNSSSPWSGRSGLAGPAFGQSAFTATPKFGASAGGSAFGQSSVPGKTGSPWGTPSVASTAGSAFGQTSTPASVFGGVPAKAPSEVPATSSPFGGGGGFGSYAQKGGFGAVATTGQSVLGSKSSAPSLTQDSTMDTDMGFGGTIPKTTTPSGGVFGNGTSFTLGSTFQGDGTAKDDLPKPKTDSSSSFFGSSFTSALGGQPKSVPVPAFGKTEANSKGSAGVTSAPSSSIFGAPSKATGSASITPTFSFPQLPNKSPSEKQSTPESKLAAPEAPSDSSARSVFGEVKPPQEPRLPPAPLPPSPKIKAEPDTDHSWTPVRSDRSIPEAPLPPDSTSKPGYAPGDSSGSSITTNKTASDDIPLPPDFVLRPRDDGGDTSAETQALPTQGEESDGLDENGSGGDEGSGVDVAAELSPPLAPKMTPSITPQSSFGGLSNTSPLGGSFAQVPAAVSQPKPLFGEITLGPQHHFAIPRSTMPQSPRSPSPVRRTLSPTRAIRMGASKTMGASTTANRPSILDWEMPRTPNQPVSQPPAALEQARPTLFPNSSIRAHDVNEKLAQTEPSVRKESEEQQHPEKEVTKEKPSQKVLTDEQHEIHQQMLASWVEGTTTLNTFIAHQDYVGEVEREGPSGHIEALYRDINSMVDTLGLNARSLSAFIKGHSEQFKNGGRTREDLDHEDDWCLIEISELDEIEADLAAQLREGRVGDVQGKLKQCRQLQQELIRVRSKHSEIKKMVEISKNPAQIAANRAMGLSSDQSTQQNDVRKRFNTLQRLLSEAEEGLSLLKSRLVSQQSNHGAGKGRQAPTVEAVMKTVMKMTSMVEKKSGDIDVLEKELRKMRLGSIDSRASREGSPAVNLASRGAAMRTPASNKSNRSLYYTPESKKGTPTGLRASLGGSATRSVNGTPRKAIANIPTEEVERTWARMSRRKVTVDKLKQAICKAGPRIKTMED